MLCMCVKKKTQQNSKEIEKDIDSFDGIEACHPSWNGDVCAVKLSKQITAYNKNSHMKINAKSLEKDKKKKKNE